MLPSHSPGLPQMAENEQQAALSERENQKPYPSNNASIEIFQTNSWTVTRFHDWHNHVSKDDQSTTNLSNILKSNKC